MDLIIVVVLIVGFVVYAHFHNQPKLKTANRTYKLLEAKTPAQQAQGLSGRPSLPTNEAMIFIFKEEGRRCFWMKGMRFPLDFVWTNAKGQVVAIEQNVSPNTFPEQFCSEQSAQYVFELNAGQAKVANITYGQTLSF